MFNILLLFLICFNVALQALDIDTKSSNVDLLSSSSLFIENGKKLTYNDITHKKFHNISEDILEFGFLPHKRVWIKFTLRNNSNKSIDKILEYNNPETEIVSFYDTNKTYLDGMWHIPSMRKSLNPIFNISLKPFEKKTYYLSASSNITTLVVQLILWNHEPFLEHMYEEKMYLFTFFAIIFILFIYNTMLLYFTKDRVYFYYILYLAAIIFFQSIYLGIAQLYLFSHEVSTVITKATIGYITLLVIPIILFIREFLNTKQFPKLDFILKAYFYILPLISVLSYDNIVFNQNIMILFIPLGISIVYTSYYALFHGVKQAKFYVIGWSIVISAMILSVLKSFGFFNGMLSFYYLNELAFIAEALLFSIALAHKINILSEEKVQINKKYIQLQKEEQKRLEILVNEKTADLLRLVEEKDILYKELNHRVKNNLAMIVALIQLQIKMTNSQNTKDAFEITKNRVNSIAKMYEMFRMQNTMLSVDTLLYFQNIVETIQENFHQDIDIIYDVTCDLKFNNLVYCGLVLNEVVTNAFKYAFDSKGKIFIRLHKENKFYTLSIQDDGKGFTPTQSKSLGLIIVKNIVLKQLCGEYKIERNKGTNIIIKWEYHEQ